MSVAEIGAARAAMERPARTVSPAPAVRKDAWRAGLGSAAPAVAAIVAAGLALRVACSGGPLWIDELWSIMNLDPIRHFWGVLWGISHDNNHFLNSLWLFFADPLSENPTWLRLPSILAGALSIGAMARLGARRNAAAAVAGALVVAFSYFFINYSEEARGYATAMLALMIGYDCLERAMDDPASGARYGLAAAAGIGLFCHFAIGPAICLFGFIALGELYRRSRDARASVVATFRIFWPAALAMVPAVACVVAGYFVMGGFTIGGVKDFTIPAAIAGMAKMAIIVLGLPEAPAAVAFAVIVLPLAIAAALALGLVRADRRIAFAMTLLALPLIVLAAHPPNTNIPRYYFVSAVFLALFVAELFGALWEARGSRRIAGVAALGAILVGGGAQTAAYQAGKFPAWPEALDLIAASGATQIGGLYDRNVHSHIDFYNRSHARRLEFISPDRLCATPPQWIAAGINDVAREPPPASLVEGDGCALRFELKKIVGAPGLSQAPWALYRRAETADAR